MAERDEDHDAASGLDALQPLSALEQSTADTMVAYGHDTVEVRRVLGSLRLVERERRVREICGELSSIERRRVYRKLRDSDALPEKVAITVLHRRHIERMVGGKPLSPKELHMLTIAEGKGMSEEDIASEIQRKRAAP